MADRIVIMRDGVIQQVASPDEMYAHPVNIFVAGFIGSPPMNFFRSRLVREGDDFAVSFAGCTLAVDIDPGVAAEHTDAPVVAGVRPECLLVASAAQRNAVELPVALVESLGGERHVHVELAPENVATVTSAREGDDAAMPRMIARIIGAPAVDEGSRIRLGIDPGHIHVFDSATEAALN